MSELKKCPFCGGEAAYTQILGNYERPHEVYCSTCDGGITEGRSKDGVIHNWNNRPIEDALNNRIAELEQDLSNKETEYTDLWDDAVAFQSRIAELEANNDRLQDTWFEDETICPDGSLKPKVSTLLSRIAELEAAQHWIPVSERLPEIGVRVLFYNNFIKNIHKGWYSGDEWTSDIGIFYNGGKLKRITHWMPLPSAPESEDE